MGDVTDKGRIAWRQYVVDGVPSSGEQEPDKEEIQDFVDAVETATSRVLAGATVVASLPAAATVGAGVRGFVTDATATTFHSTVSGGGANKVPVVSDGTNWLIG
jgi:hypothetical protein